MGVDGCKGGWVRALFEGDHMSLDFVSRLADLEPADLTLIDIPLGFAVSAYRSSEREAQKLLGKRRSSIFLTPLKECLTLSYSEASSLNRERLGKSFSKQAFYLFPKILEALEWQKERYLLESHPELCFLGFSGKPCSYSKKSQEGIQERLGIIKKIDKKAFKMVLDSPLRVNKDDLIDAVILGLAAKMGPQLEYLYDSEGSGSICYFKKNNSV